jgi:hypothetical protein
VNEMELGLSDVPVDLSRSALGDIPQDVKLFCHFGHASHFADPGCLDLPVWDDAEYGADE